MADIRFYIPKHETIPTDLRLYVDDVYVTYEAIDHGFRFYVLLDDEKKAMKVVEQIVAQIKHEHDEPQHGVSWRTLSLEVVPQDDRFFFETVIEWKFRVRDSY